MSTTHDIESRDFTYDLIKLLIFTQGSLCRNIHSAAGTFVIALV